VGTGRLEPLDSEACLELLASQVVGRVAFVLDGRPVILPVNYAVDGWTIVFRTTYGGKLVAASAGDFVAFEADAYDPATGAGWSVVVQGIAETVHDEEIVAGLEQLELDTWVGGDRKLWVRVHPDELSGRRLRSAHRGRRSEDAADLLEA
jgi:uncharacterized protein